MENLLGLQLPPFIGMDTRSKLTDMRPGYVRNMVNLDIGVTGKLRPREGWGYESVAGTILQTTGNPTSIINDVVHQRDGNGILRTFILLGGAANVVMEYNHTTKLFTTFFNFGAVDEPKSAVLVGNTLYVAVKNPSSGAAIRRIALYPTSGTSPSNGYAYDSAIRKPSEILAVTDTVATSDFAVSFSNTATEDQYLQGNSPLVGFERTDSFSIEFFAKIPAFTSPLFMFLFSQLRFGAYTSGITTFLNADGSFSVKIAGTTAPQAIQKTTTTLGYDNNSKHQFAFTYNGSSLASGLLIYVDGTLQATTTNLDTLASNMNIGGSNFRFGRKDGAELASLIGTADGLRIYNKVLSASEITTHYAGGAGLHIIAENNLVSGYNFNEGIGTTTSDVSGNGATLNLINTPTWVTPGLTTAGGIGSGELNGTYRWRIVLKGIGFDGKIYYSQPGEPSNELKLINQNASVNTTILATSGLATLNVLIYRIGGTLDSWLKIQEKAIVPTGGSLAITDSISDIKLALDPNATPITTFDNVQLLNDAVAGGIQSANTKDVLIEYYGNRLWICASGTDNKIYPFMEQVGLDWNLEYALVKEALGAVFSEPVIKLLSTKIGLLVFKEHSIDLVTGSSPPFRVETIQNEYGAINRKSISVDNNGRILFQSHKGLMRFDLNNFEDLSYYVQQDLRTFKATSADVTSVYYKNKAIFFMAHGNPSNSTNQQAYVFSDISQGMSVYSNLAPYWVFVNKDDLRTQQEELLLIFLSTDFGYGAPLPAGGLTPVGGGYFIAKFVPDMADHENLIPTEIANPITLETGYIQFPMEQSSLVKVPRYLDVDMKMTLAHGADNGFMKNIRFAFDDQNLQNDNFSPTYPPTIPPGGGGVLEYIKMQGELTVENPNIWRAYFARRAIFAQGIINPEKHLRGNNLRLLFSASATQKVNELGIISLSYKVKPAKYRHRSTQVSV